MKRVEPHFAGITWLGATFWLLGVLLTWLRQAPFHSLTWLLLFAILVIMPLLITLVTTPLPASFWLVKSLKRGYLAAATLATLSFLLPTGDMAAFFILPWLGLTSLLALLAFWRFQQKQWHIEEILINAGLLYSLIGGFWLIVARAGNPFLGFQEPFLSLTALHFHYISLAGLILAGMIGRQLRCFHPHQLKQYQPPAIGLLIAPLLVAIGITYSLLIESLAALLLVICLLWIITLGWRYGLPTITHPLTKNLLTISYATIFLTMLLAALYALGRLTGLGTLTIPTMIHWHGWLNALGFAFCGLYAWSLQLD